MWFGSLFKISELFGRFLVTAATRSWLGDDDDENLIARRPGVADAVGWFTSRACFCGMLVRRKKHLNRLFQLSKSGLSLTVTGRFACAK